MRLCIAQNKLCSALAHETVQMRGVAVRQRVVGDVPRDHGAGAYYRVASYGVAAYYRGVRAYGGALLHCYALPALLLAPHERARVKVVREHHVGAYHDVVLNHGLVVYAGVVLDLHAVPYPHPLVYVSVLSYYAVLPHGGVLPYLGVVPYPGPFSYLGLFRDFGCPVHQG
jgi:hypothetical protein